MACYGATIPKTLEFGKRHVRPWRECESEKEKRSTGQEMRRNFGTLLGENSPRKRGIKITEDKEQRQRTMRK